MKRMLLSVAMVAVLAVGTLHSLRALAADEAPVRTLQGQVLDRSDAGLSEAIVYLKNTKNLTIRTFIADKEGNYHFTALSPNVDYEVYADYRGKKSSNKTLSSFDSRASAVINIKIDTTK